VGDNIFDDMVEAALIPLFAIADAQDYLEENGLLKE
jgi:hypothetical protein